MNAVMNSRPILSLARAWEPPATSWIPAAFSEQLWQLYQLVQHSQQVFGSPLGPFPANGRALYLPRFVYFGSPAADALRLSFLAGWDHRDLRPTLALLRLVEGIARKPDLGHGLHLTFFPLIDVLGLADRPEPRDLAQVDWSRSTAPEIRLLERDARDRGYHGFVQLETAPDEDVITVRLRAPVPLENVAPALELISSDDVAPFAVRWESENPARTLPGPLSIADDLPLSPFELTVRIPAGWPLDLYAEATASILKRFVLRYRGFISYAQHL